MFKNKLVITFFIIILIMSLFSLGGWFAYQSFFVKGAEQKKVEKKLSPDEIVEQSVTTETITTNLYSDNYIMIQFSILLESLETKEELEKRMPEVKSNIIAILSSMTPEDLKGEEGIRKLEELIKDRVNKLLQTGKVVNIYTTERKIQ